MSQDDAVVLEGVRRSFSGKPVLRGITARAGRGRVIGLLGRNGEGKSTLIKIMLDIVAADAGRLEVLGRSPDGSAAIRRIVGYVPERPVFHDFMTVAEVFAFRERFFPTWSREKAAASAAKLGLDPSQKVAGASKGTLGKLAWVCATAHQPELLLLDEPTSGLDALVRDDLLSGLIEELHGSGRTILVANHHMEEFAGLLDEVWVMSGGAITGVHDMQTLRSQACRIRGRRKAGAAVPAPAIVLSEEGSLVEWAALRASDADCVAASGALDGFEKESLPIEEILKALLKTDGGGSHD
ncbi:MAG: ABC transporter ATP-binding protein [Elusimicrobia bacterium]|nr:ABC transporter ATP-binding protein [Elusimicrobiota bacterium]